MDEFIFSCSHAGTTDVGSVLGILTVGLPLMLHCLPRSVGTSMKHLATRLAWELDCGQGCVELHRLQPEFTCRTDALGVRANSENVENGPV